MSVSKYDQRGVSADKSEVHKAIKKLDKGLFPNAFCKVLPDIAASDPAWCNLMHADTAGTKTALAYLYYKETGDVSVFGGIAQDAMVMNLDDMACVGATDDILLSSTIGRNKNQIPGEVITAIIEQTVHFADQMRKHGIHLHLAGGETADVGDIVRTIDVGYTAFARLPRHRIHEINIQPGDVIVGLASYGQATYEDSYNSGIASNGLTAARHDTLSHYYAEQYPEAFDPAIPDDLVFTGPHRLTDKALDTDYTVGELLLSPTRTFAPLLKQLFDQYHDHLHGVIHNTGGAHSKVLKFVEDVHIIKDQLLPVPPVFQLIQQASGTPWDEMYQVFNMGTRLEIYLPENIAGKIINLAQSFKIDAQVIGHVEAHTGKQVTLQNTPAAQPVVFTA